MRTLSLPLNPSSRVEILSAKPPCVCSPCPAGRCRAPGATASPTPWVPRTHPGSGVQGQHLEPESRSASDRGRAGPPPQEGASTSCLGSPSVDPQDCCPAHASRSGWVPSWAVHVHAQSRLTLCDPMNCSPPGFSVHGILQARILEWVAISFSRGSSQPRDRTQVSCIAGRFFTI